MRITIVGHSTVLIEVRGMKILTDPFFAQGGNPVFQRIRPPAFSRLELCDAGLVLISHPHFDHADGAYLRLIPKETPVVTSWAGNGLLRLMGGKHLTAARPGQSMRFGPVEIHAVPASHFGITVGFVIQAEGKQVYFAGDTFYGPFMRSIGERFHLNAALIPVTTFVTPMTMDNSGAVKAVRDLRPGLVIPIHQGIQPALPLLRRKETPETFARRLAEEGIHIPVKILKDGEKLEI